MRKSTLLNRLAVMLLTAMMMLTNQAFAQWDAEKSLNFECKVGEVIVNPLPGANFSVIQNDVPESLGIISSFSKRYPINPEIKLYSLDTICCLKRGSVFFYASKLDDNGYETLYTININITGNATALGWHGGKGPDLEAAIDTMRLAPGYRANPLPSFFVCTEAQMVNDHMVCSWEEISPKTHPYDYESSNSDVAFQSPYHCNGDSLMSNGTGETTITMRTLQAEEYIAKNGKLVSFPKLKHTFVVLSKFKMEIVLDDYPNKEETLLIDDGDEILTYHGFCTSFSVRTENTVEGVSIDPANYNKELIVRLTDDSPTDVIEISEEVISGDKKYCIMAKDYGTAKVEIIMPECEETFGSWTDYYYEGRDTLTIHVEPNGFDLIYPNYPLGYEDYPDQYVYELNLTEGDTVPRPQLIKAGPGTWERFHPHRMTVSMNGRVAMPMDGKRVTDSLHAVAAGEDEVVYIYRRSDNCTPTITRLPVHITPLLPPVTQLNLSVEPTEEDNIVLNAYYNSANQQVEIDDAQTDAAVEEAMKDKACGTEEWKEALPNTLSFNLPAGKVSVSIVGWTETGYELRAKVRGKEVQAIHTQTNGAQNHTFTLDLEYPSTIVFYMVRVPATGSGSPAAPRRVRQSVAEEAISFIKSINIDIKEIFTGIEDVQRNQVQSKKMIENGQLYLMYKGQVYDVRGQRVK